MHKHTTIVTLILLLLGCVAAADPRGNTREAVANKREQRVDRRESVDDVLDLKRIQGLLARFEAARAKTDMQQLAALDVEIVTLARREAREDRVELAKDEAELRRSRREVRRDRRELRGSRTADDRRDLRDDRRDRRDDRRVVAVEASMLAKRRAIANRLLALAGKHDAPSLAGKQAALVDLVALARIEVAQNTAERREDRRERREDRRERREDRR